MATKKVTLKKQDRSHLHMMTLRIPHELAAKMRAKIGLVKVNTWITSLIEKAVEEP